MIEAFPPDRSDDALDIGVLPPLGHWRSPPSSRPGFPPPEQPKASSVPANDGLRLDDDDDAQAARPQTIEPDPEEPVDPGPPEPGRPFALEYGKLVAKGNEFELRRGLVSKAPEDGRSQKSEDRMHPSTLSPGSPSDSDWRTQRSQRLQDGRSVEEDQRCRALNRWPSYGGSPRTNPKRPGLLWVSKRRTTSPSRWPAPGVRPTKIEKSGRSVANVQQRKCEHKLHARQK